MPEPLIVARVLLRTAEGERPGIDVPITADTIPRLTPPSEAVAAVSDHFRGAGFSLLGGPAITIGIAGSKAQFERHFGVKLTHGKDQTYTVRRARQRGVARSAADDIVDPTSIPVDRLPPSIRRAVSQVALETAASIDQPGVDP
ncbi:hypothetical protein [Variovorax sp. JS1663]|uniref:hypothetical protein n=1 Tax=Variovorax sp. JS1663 TaxID=1851577 RepID=UPI000B349A84|nr:hypothetical protein [Variovorax sp. JS1663]OUL99794.1 hypothetical protein A8M77_24605 [Variovorax sp. JS1663]